MQTPTTLRISISCGARTCAAEPGKFCRFMGSVKFGTIPVCRLFPSDTDSYTVLHADAGWVQRCDACKEAAR